MALLEFFNRQVQGLDKEFKNIAQEEPESTRLMTIEGVGPVSAVAVNCWIGTIERFVNAKKLSSYFGLTSKVRQPHHVTGSDRAMSQQLQHFFPMGWCFPVLARHFRWQIRPRKLLPVPEGHMSHLPARLRGAWP